jgi:hypothetical protein
MNLIVTLFANREHIFWIKQLLAHGGYNPIPVRFYAVVNLNINLFALRD